MCSAVLLIHKLPIDLLKQIQGFLLNYRPCIHTWRNLITQNSLDGIKFLHNNNKEGCTVLAMNYAAKDGHLELVKWLHENRTVQQML